MTFFIFVKQFTKSKCQAYMYIQHDELLFIETAVCGINTQVPTQSQVVKENPILQH